MMKQCDEDGDGPGDLEEVKYQVYDAIKTIIDPEKPQSLEDLGVVSEENVSVKLLSGSEDLLITVKIVPTVPHCSLAALIGLCIRERLQQELGRKHKVDIFIAEGTHETADEINKQLNDKERVAAALENPNLKEIVDQCLEPTD